MSELKQYVSGDEDENTFVLRPYGLLVLKLASEGLAQRTHDALELHMRKHKQAIHVENDGLHFSDGLDDEDFAIISAAILWYDLKDGHLREEYERKLCDAVQAARNKTWAKRREESKS